MKKTLGVLIFIIYYLLFIIIYFEADPSLYFTVIFCTIPLLILIILILIKKYREYVAVNNRIDTIITDTSSIPELIHNNFIYEKNKIISIRGTESTNPIIDNQVENDECCICLEKFEKNDVLYPGLLCKHKFHSKCLNQWLSFNNTCPTCRIEVI